MVLVMVVVVVFPLYSSVDIKEYGLIGTENNVLVFTYDL